MSDEQFLTRWSRRKQEAKAGHAEPEAEEASPVHGSASLDRVASGPIPVETELSNLPPIESIDAATDIRAFLRKGIPQELSRAALRRAWSADPAIRDFVGLAENAWDFNDPNAMAGFGPLDYSAERVDGLVRRIVSGVVETAENLTNQPGEAGEGAGRPAREEVGFAQSSNAAKVTTDPQPQGKSAVAELSSGSAASQPAAPREETPLPRRTHGGALPQ
ncbi:DUF3306 domain-containing protein [Bradyrhizobium sp. ISRA464]|uniref:DUF3306 domain-containing protein n=1 Tax=Bradyrhizobium sp. ISRA464 TaxID=2866200 RepID=UPI002478C66F|nr:DUF3306 domain-containing protein [Bradyrhizobium sp. ISRA464]WGS24890.1 DUF3306 domain-containing protein [Bradyrhizobium sp. ISRA464]